MGMKGRRAKAERARVEAMRSLAWLAGAAVGYAALTAAFGAAVAVLDEQFVAVVSVVSLVASVGCLVGVVALEARAWKKTVASCGDAIGGADKFLLGATLWFAGGLPLCLVNIVEHLAGAIVLSDPTITYAQAGLSAALLVCAFLRFWPYLRKR